MTAGDFRPEQLKEAMHDVSESPHSKGALGSLEGWLVWKIDRRSVGKMHTVPRA